MSEDCKKVLIVAYHFPPSAAVGALRPQKFAKYLPEFGWEPHVLTIREKFAESLDPERLVDVQGINIVRTDFWRSPLSFYLETKARWLKWRGGKKTDPPSVAVPCQDLPTKRPFGVRFKHYLWELNTFPDASFYWTVPAVIAGVRLMRRERIRCVYATIPQPTAALVGYFLALLTGSRLVLDFRDPWAGARFPGDWRSGIYDKLEAWVERLTVARAFRVICTNEWFRLQLQENYPDLPAEKFVTIPNGYDAEDQGSTPLPRENGQFVISYLGTFYLDRNPETLFAALQAGIVDGSFSAQEIEIRLIGQVASSGKGTTQELVNAYGLDGVVKIVGQVPHRIALQQMQESDLLLLLAPNQPDQIPGKAFEYIGAKRPILALTEEGATADLIRETRAGLVVRQDDVAGIGAALAEMVRLHQAGEEPWYQGCDFKRYERMALTEELAAILDAVPSLAPAG